MGACSRSAGHGRIFIDRHSASVRAPDTEVKPLWSSLELFGARIKLIGSSPSAIRWGTDTFGNAAALGWFDAGPPLGLAVIRAAPGSTP